MFKDIFVNLLQKNNISAYKLSKDTGITEGLISQWKSGRQLPKYDSIKILCDYFDISADYLLERTDIPEMNKGNKPELNAEEILQKQLLDFSVGGIAADTGKHFEPESPDIDTIIELKKD